MGGESELVELVRVRTDQSRIFARGRLCVDGFHDAPVGIGVGDDHLNIRGDKAINAEDLRFMICLDHRQNGSVLAHPSIK